MKKILFLMLMGCLVGMVSGSTITLNTPTNGFYSRDATPDFNFTVIGNNATYNCVISASTGGSAYTSYSAETSIVNDTYTVITATSMPVADYKWKVNCTNATFISANDFFSTTRNLYIGTSNYGALDRLSKFIGDIVIFFPKMITLVILGLIISVMFFLGKWIKGNIKFN